MLCYDGWSRCYQMCYKCFYSHFTDTNLNISAMAHGPNFKLVLKGSLICQTQWFYVILSFSSLLCDALRLRNITYMVTSLVQR